MTGGISTIQNVGNHKKAPLVGCFLLYQFAGLRHVDLFRLPMFRAGRRRGGLNQYESLDLPATQDAIGTTRIITMFMFRLGIRN